MEPFPVPVTTRRHARLRPCVSALSVRSARFLARCPNRDLSWLVRIRLVSYRGGWNRFPAFALHHTQRGERNAFNAASPTADPTRSGRNLGLALTGCTGDAGGGGTEEAADCGPYEAYGTFDEGTEVSIYGTISDVEADRLDESWADFETCTGIDVVYEPSKEFETQIDVRAQGGNPPNLAIFPQPGLLADAGRRRLRQAGARGRRGQRRGVLVRGLAGLRHRRRHALRRAADGERQGLRLVLAGDVRGERLGGPRDARRAASTLTAGRSPHRVWSTALVRRLRLRCRHRLAGHRLGRGHRAAPGRPRGLRPVGRQRDPVHRPADHRRRSTPSASHPLTTRIRQRRTRRRRTRSTTTEFGDAGLPILDGTLRPAPPGVVLRGLLARGHDGRARRRRLGVPLPGTEAGANAVTGGGEIVAAFSDADEVAAVQEYLSSADWANSRVTLGGVISANKGLDPANASSALLSKPSRSCRTPRPRSASTPPT